MPHSILFLSAAVAHFMNFMARDMIFVAVYFMNFYGIVYEFL